MKPPRIRWPRSRTPDPAAAAAAAPDEPPAEQHAAAAPDPDWFDRLYADKEDAEEAEEPEPTRPPWHYVLPGPFGGHRAPDPAPAPQEPPAAAPGVNIYLTPPPPPSAPPGPDPARARRRRWLAIHGALAGVGWYIGLGPALTDLYVSSGHSAPAVGAGMVLISWIFGAYLPGLPYVPAQLRPVVIAICRIPACTAVLALALHAPNALI